MPWSCCLEAFFFPLVSWLLRPIQAPVLQSSTQPWKQGSRQEKQSTGSLSVPCLPLVEQLPSSRSVIIPGKVSSSHGRLLEQHGAFVGSVNHQANVPSRSDIFFFKYVSNCFFTDWSLPFNDSHFNLVSFQHGACPPSQCYNPPRSHPQCQVTPGEILKDPFCGTLSRCSAHRGCFLGACRNYRHSSQKAKTEVQTCL